MRLGTVPTYLPGTYRPGTYRPGTYLPTYMQNRSYQRNLELRSTFIMSDRLY